MDHSSAFLPEHSGWRSADQRLLADIPRCLMSSLGFHWLANERPGQRHWTDKNKVTCLASDEDFFFLSLVVPRDTNDLGSSAARHLIWLWTLLVILTSLNAVHPLFSLSLSLSLTTITLAKTHTHSHKHHQIQTYDYMLYYVLHLQNIKCRLCKYKGWTSTGTTYRILWYQVCFKVSVVLMAVNTSHWSWGQRETCRILFAITWHIIMQHPVQM